MQRHRITHHLTEDEVLRNRGNAPFATCGEPAYPSITTHDKSALEAWLPPLLKKSQKFHGEFVGVARPASGDIVSIAKSETRI